MPTGLLKETLSRRSYLNLLGVTGITWTSSKASANSSSRPLPGQQFNYYFPDPDDNQAGVEACDVPGATIVLQPRSTYLIDNPPLEVTSDNVSILGSRSSVLKVADGVLPGNNSVNAWEISGVNSFLHGFTFDGNEANQDATDAYGIMWTSASADNATVSDLHNYNACGDAFGKVRNGTRIVNCYAEGFTEDGVDYWGSSNTTITNSVFMGRVPLKIRSRAGNNEFGGLSVSNCALIGTDTAGVRIALYDSSFTVQDISISNSLIRRKENDQAVMLTGPEGTIKDVTFDNCTVEAPNRGVYTSGGVDVIGCTFDGGCVSADWAAFDLENTKRFVIDEPRIQDVTLAAKIESDCRDTRIAGDLSGGVDDSGIRTVLNGWGTSSGPPANSTEWDGNGYEGLEVLDTTSGEKYLYRAGNWV